MYTHKHTAQLYLSIFLYAAVFCLVCQCTGRSGRLRPPLGSCAAIARGSVGGSTWRSRGTRTAARAGHRLHLPSTAGTSSPPLPFRRSGGNCCCASDHVRNNSGEGLDGSDAIARKREIDESRPQEENTQGRSKSTSKGLRGKRDGLCPSKTHESYTIPAMYLRCTTRWL